MKAIPPKRKLPKCVDNPDQSGEHDFNTERQDRRTNALLGKREKKLYKAGWRRCWWCGVWADIKGMKRDKKIRKKLIKRWGLEKYKRMERKGRKPHGIIP